MNGERCERCGVFPDQPHRYGCRGRIRRSELPALCDRSGPLQVQSSWFKSDSDVAGETRPIDYRVSLDTFKILAPHFGGDEPEIFRDDDGHEWAVWPPKNRKLDWRVWNK